MCCPIFIVWRGVVIFIYWLVVREEEAKYNSIHFYKLIASQYFNALRFLISDIGAILCVVFYGLLNARCAFMQEGRG